MFFSLYLQTKRVIVRRNFVPITGILFLKRNFIFQLFYGNNLEKNELNTTLKTVFPNDEKP